MHSIIYLTGFMGSGKTTHGKKIARMMGYSFIDLDDYISMNEGKSVQEIFNHQGEQYFRELERQSLSSLASIEKLILSTGGGTPCFHNNLEFMKDNGLVIYLKLSPEALYSRLKNSKSERPLLAGKSEAELIEYIRGKLNEREPFYNKAHMIIDGLHSVDERLVNAIQRK